MATITLPTQEIHQTTSQVVVTNTLPAQAAQVAGVVRAAYGVPLHEETDGCMSEQDVLNQIRHFPEGQFVATYEGKAVGMACTMRTRRTPYEPALSWMEQIGDMGISAHEADGEWLYGGEFTVHPDYRKMGIGGQLYRARFEMIKRLNLRGFHMVGMLMGYHRFQHLMSVREYGLKVIYGEFRDPTVSMQMNKGFQPLTIVEDYLPEPEAGNAGVHMVWLNPDYQAERT